MAKDIDQLKANGFIGFFSIARLQQERGLVPDVPGIYLVVRPNDEEPQFLEHGTGGYFKGEDPNVSIEELRKNWVESSHILYIGKASTSLRNRVGVYMRFGMGFNSPHKGGRYIWQLKGIEDCLVCWNPIHDCDLGEIESQMIESFILWNGKRPFANLNKGMSVLQIDNPKKGSTNKNSPIESKYVNVHFHYWVQDEDDSCTGFSGSFLAPITRKQASTLLNIEKEYGFDAETFKSRMCKLYRKLYSMALQDYRHTIEEDLLPKLHGEECTKRRIIDEIINKIICSHSDVLSIDIPRNLKKYL